MQRIGLEFQELYQKTPPQGDPLPGLQKFEIADDIPDEEEIATALGNLRTGKSPGPSGIRSEDLQKWHREREDNPTPWLAIIDMVQAAFASGELPTLLHCNILVLIPKSEPGKVRGIGLLESLWKLITTIIHCRLMKGITFHPDMHGFLPKKGCSTACMEAKLQMQHLYCTGQPLYQIFIDVSKAYDGLDRDRTLQLLKEYGVGKNIIRILRNFWAMHTIIPRQKGCYGTPFPAERGITQGDIVSPTIFNIVIDTVLQHWYRSMAEKGYNTTTLRFYADDGLLADTNAHSLQFGVNEITRLFLCFGLQLNGPKTKAMISIPPTPTTQILQLSYSHRMTGMGLSFHERAMQLTNCPTCGNSMNQGNLRNHMLTVHRDLPGIATLASTTNPNSQDGLLFINLTPDQKAYAQCPIPYCRVPIKGWDGMRRHFQHRHHTNDIYNIHEGYFPRCQ